MIQECFHPKVYQVYLTRNALKGHRKCKTILLDWKKYVINYSFCLLLNKIYSFIGYNVDQEEWILAREATLSKMLLLPLTTGVIFIKERFAPHGKKLFAFKLDPFFKRALSTESNKVVSRERMVRKKIFSPAYLLYHIGSLHYKYGIKTNDN